MKRLLCLSLNVPFWIYEKSTGKLYQVKNEARDHVLFISNLHTGYYILVLDVQKEGGKNGEKGGREKRKKESRGGRRKEKKLIPQGKSNLEE